MPSIKAQTTFTTNLLKADSATIQYTKTDSLRSVTVNTDTMHILKDAFIHQDMKINGDAIVQGKVVVNGSIVFDTSGFALKNAVMTTTAGNINLLYAGALPNNPGDPGEPIELDVCTNTVIVSPGHESASGFVATSIGPGRNSGLAIYAAPWGVGNGFIECQGTSDALLVNYFCGKDIYLGTGNGNPTTGHKSKIYTGEFVNMKKHVEIGDPVYGTGNDPTNINLESTSHTEPFSYSLLRSAIHTGIANIRARTYSINTSQLSVFNTNTGSTDPIYAYNGRYTFAVYGDGRTVIRRLNTTQPLLSIGKFTSGSNTDVGVERFKVYADGKTIIGSEKVIGTHSDALLQVAGKIASKSLYVLKPTTWADNVFKDKNKLMSLEEIEKFIHTHHHLPDIPSEKEILEKGYDVNEMNTLLLKKIEELYLIVIQQQKEIDKLKGK
jgi:hypothetical protein